MIKELFRFMHNYYPHKDNLFNIPNYIHMSLGAAMSKDSAKMFNGNRQTGKFTMNRLLTYIAFHNCPTL